MMQPEESPGANAARRGSWPLAVAVLLWASAWGLHARLAAPPAPLAADAPADAFSAGRAEAVLARLAAGEEAHPTGSAAARSLADRILAELSALGLAPEVQEVFACGPYRTCGTMRNLFARLPFENGRGEREGRSVLLVAHYDSVPAGPGIADDLAGVATLLEVARAMLASGPARNPVLLLVTDGEEAGLVGAQGFVDEHPAFAEARVVVNVEARGASGPSILFETSADNAWLVGLYAREAARPSATSVSYEVYRRMPNDTDLTVFKAAGLSGVNFAFLGDVQRYHTPRDSLAGLSRASLQHQGQNVLAMAGGLAGASLAAQPKGDAVYADVFGRVLLRLPPGVCRGIALLALALLFGAAGRLRRAGGLDVRRALGAVVALAAAALAPVLACAALWLLIATLSGSSAAWFAEPLPAEIAFGATALVATIRAVRALGGRPGPLALAYCAWLAWAAIGLALAILLPGLGYLVFVPAIGAALAWLPFGRDREARDAGAVVVPALVAVALAAIVWVPVQYGVELAFGLYGGLAMAIPAAFLGTLLAPLVALDPIAIGATSTRALSVLLGLAAFVSTVVALVLPRHTTELPAPLDIVYSLDAGANGDRRATWQVRASEGTLPDAMGDVAPFAERERGLFEAPAPPLDYAPAELEVESSEVFAGTSERDPWRSVHCRLRSPGGADRTQIVVPGLRAATVGGRSLAGGGPIVLLGVPEEGVLLELDLMGSTPVTVVITDVHLGLPPEGADLAAARPPEFVPSGEGDRTVVRSRGKL